MGINIGMRAMRKYDRGIVPLEEGLLEDTDRGANKKENRGRREPLWNDGRRGFAGGR